MSVLFMLGGSVKRINVRPRACVVVRPLVFVLVLPLLLLLTALFPRVAR